MKTIGVRALRENPGVLAQCASAGEFILFTNRNAPLSLAVPFDDDLIRTGLHVSVAIKLVEEGVLTIVKAAALARMPVETFIKTLAHAGIVLVDQSSEELDDDLETLEHSVTRS